MRNWQREWPSIRQAKLASTDDVHVYLGLDREPELTDYISAERLAAITQEISRRRVELGRQPRQISASDIPVKATPIACTWRANDWFSREELVAIFKDVLVTTQTMSADVDENVFANIDELIEEMDAAEDNLESELASESVP